jgi:acetyltransferase-like isoleucine patch superfamily enzyme
MSLFRAAKSLIRQSRAFRSVRNRLRFPGLSVDSDVQIIGRALRYGPGSSVGAGSILQAIGPGSILLGEGSYLGRQVEIGGQGNVSVGRYASIQDRCIVLGDVEIGAYCTFAPNVYVSSGRHYFRLHPEMLIRDQDEMVLSDPELSKAHSRPVHIGEDVWAGINAVLMAGITIGRGAVVGANSVVCHDVPPYTVVAGTPAAEVGKRLDFCPPPRIDASTVTHWPYFYAGFGQRAADRATAGRAGGLPAGKHFSICLAAHRGAGEVVLRVRRLGSAPVNIRHETSTQTLDDAEWREVRFAVDVARAPSTPLDFVADFPSSAGVFGLLVSSAALQ